ncbi:MAG: hypothetical protein Q4G30_04385 [Actinomycetaceae bacterium]|nr:hypothetical protein [Actinomycetaceae bacterium]
MHAVFALLPELAIPTTFVRVHTQTVTHNGLPACLERWQDTEVLRYGGPHITTVTGLDDNVLYGFTAQLPADNAAKLPDKQQAEDIARRFFEDVDPLYAQGLSLQWVDRHDETVTDAAGNELIVPGIKVKMRHTSGLYAWGIVGAGSRIVTYERDVSWNTEHAHRNTAMWLHDRWIVALQHGGPALPPPAAGLDAC